MGSLEISYFRFYSATKFAVNGLIEGWRQSVREIKSQIRISGLSPGKEK